MCSFSDPGREQSVQVGKHQQKCSICLCAPVKEHLCEILCVLVSGRTGNK